MKNRKFKCVIAVLLAAVMCFSMTACGSSKKEKKKIIVGASNFTEKSILGEMYAQLIKENTDYEVEERQGLAGVAVCFDALENHEIDMFVSYTGSALLYLLGETMTNDSDEAWQRTHDIMLNDHNVFTSNPLGFNNTYVMSVKKETAGKYGLKNLTDLIDKSPELKLGCTVEFLERQDGLPLFENKYGASFKEKTGLDANLRYDALEADEVDVVDAFATDALLSKMGLVKLEDNLQFFPPYSAVNFVDNDLIKSDPKLAELLARLDGAIDEDTMAAMNAEVDIDGRNAKDVAHDFLVSKGLISK